MCEYCSRVQLLLTGLTLPSSRPLIPIEAAMVLLDRNEDEVPAAVESGRSPGLGLFDDPERSGARFGSGGTRSST